jgi:hypothetical protein
MFYRKPKHVSLEQMQQVLLEKLIVISRENGLEAGDGVILHGAVPNGGYLRILHEIKKEPIRAFVLVPALPVIYKHDISLTLAYDVSTREVYEEPEQHQYLEGQPHGFRHNQGDERGMIVQLFIMILSLMPNWSIIEPARQ